MAEDASRAQGISIQDYKVLDADCCVELTSVACCAVPLPLLLRVVIVLRKGLGGKSQECHCCQACARSGKHMMPYTIQGLDAGNMML